MHRNRCNDFSCFTILHNFSLFPCFFRSTVVPNIVIFVCTYMYYKYILGMGDILTLRCTVIVKNKYRNYHDYCQKQYAHYELSIEQED